MSDNAAGLSASPNKGQARVVKTQALEDFFSNPFLDPVKFIDTILSESVNLSASDILFEPRSENIEVRIRIDGVLYGLGTITREVFNQITARLKILARLDPTEKRKVQEGQFTINHSSPVNLRTEITQTIHGELIVIRIHERKTIVMEVSQLGLNKFAYETYQKMLSLRGGLIVVCGPTGCGKTTTLYSTIMKLNEKGFYNVMTIEDPVEYQLEGINQLQVQEDVDFTFANGLKTILRLSPDVILVGEIRDKETAEIAVESGLTGQLVVSTLHAENSVGAIFRLLDLGIESYLLNSALVGVVAQRLVRKSCQSCKKPYEPSQNELDLFQKAVGRPPKELTKSNGCNECKNLGFKGRLGIFEVLSIDSRVRTLIRSKVNETEFREKLVETGFITLLQDGLGKAEAGLTTIDEVLRNSLRVV